MPLPSRSLVLLAALSPALAGAENSGLDPAAVEFFDAQYAPNRSDPRAMPILGDHSKAPPTVLVTASLDPIRDSGRDYGSALAHRLDAKPLKRVFAAFLFVTSLRMLWQVIG